MATGDCGTAEADGNVISIGGNKNVIAIHPEVVRHEYQKIMAVLKKKVRELPSQEAPSTGDNGCLQNVRRYVWPTVVHMDTMLVC